MRACPSISGGLRPLIQQVIQVDLCETRQREGYHKCHKCIFRGAPLTQVTSRSGEPFLIPAIAVPVPAEAPVPGAPVPQTVSPQTVSTQTVSPRAIETVSAIAPPPMTNGKAGGASHKGKPGVRPIEIIDGR